MKIFLSLTFILPILYSCSKHEVFEWKSEKNITIMSFNLRYDTEEDGKNKWGNRKDACLSMMEKIKPSIMGIQEGLSHQLSFLKNSMNEYDYIGVGRDDGESSGEFNAIYYLKNRFEVLDNNTFWLSETPGEPSHGWDAECRRIVTWAHLKDLEYNKSLFVFNTHFDHIGKTSRKESAKLLVKKIKEIAVDGAPVFITGDFNALIRNPLFKPIINNFYSARRFAGYTDNIKSFNFYGRWYLSRNIDFIFYKNAYALSFRTVSEDFGVRYISDHYPILTHFNYE